MSQQILIATIMRPEGDTGVQTHFRAYMGYLGEIGRRCDLVTPYSAPLWQVYPVFGLRKLVDLLNGAASVWWYRYWHAYFLRQALKHRLQTGASCVIYAQCPLSAQAALSARVSKNQRVVMVTHFNISQADEWAGKGLISNGGRFYCAIQAFETKVLPRLDGLVFVSDFMRRELVGRIPAITKVAAIVVPNFLPDPGLPKAQTAVADLINIGTLEARKNQQYLLEIVAALRDMGRPLSLTLVGDGPDRRVLENKARILKIDELVHFAGFVSNAAEHIGRHRACIHVAKLESFGITLIEAMARGRSVFAAPVGGVAEVLGDGTVGMALPLHDANAAAQIVAHAMGNPDWMAATGLAARERFLKEYSSGVAAKRLTQFFES
ncbi:MAG: glycosyltransferase family 4 protein [Burkholderiales bacterium]